VQEKFVIPAKAGIQNYGAKNRFIKDWIPDRAADEHWDMPTIMAAACPG
jgi:hypothetical protein